MIYIEPVITWLPWNIFEPVVAYVNPTASKSAIAVAADDAEAIKLPLTTPIWVNLVSADVVYVFNAVVDTFNVDIEVSTLLDLDSKLVNLTSCVSFVDLAADAELINEPLTTPIWVNLVSTELV